MLAGSEADMSIFQTCDSNYYTELPSGNFIAVTRYGEGMSRGLYYKTERPENICGFFYYAEPESSTYLRYNTSVTYFNKTDAALDLVDRVEGKIRAKLVKEIDKINKDIFEHINGNLPEDLPLLAQP